MRIARIVNVIPPDHSNETNEDSEPSIAVNPADITEMVITAFTPPDPGNANGPVFFSSDGGEHWSLRFDIPGGETTDQSPAFARTSGELYMGILRGDTLALNALRSADPSTGTAFASFDPRNSIDQPWVEATTVVGGPASGKDRLYLGYNDRGHKPATATVDVCLDALAANPTITQVRLDSRTPGPLDSYEIRPTVSPDGTVYVAFKSWSSTSTTSVTANVVVVRDDNWGSGGFGDLKDPSDNKAGRLVATGVVINDPASLGGIRLDNDLNIAVDPTNSDTVYIVWCDNAGPNYTLRVRRSQNRGRDWSGDLLTADNAALACLTVNGLGVVGLSYQQLVAGQMETHFRTTIDGTTWDDLLLARTATNPGFSGDYARLVAVGPHFYGVFPAMNTPDPANFFPNGGGTFRYQRNTMGTSLVGNDGITVIAASLDPFFFKVEEKECTFELDRDHYGQDEVDAARTQPTGPVIKTAFWVVVDGFTAKELAITGRSSTSVAPTIVFSPGTGVRATCTGVDSTDPAFPPNELQRFRFAYDVDFGPDDSAFNFAGQSETVTLSTTFRGIPASAQVTFMKQPDPFILQGPQTWWLSNDIRLVQVVEGDAAFGVTMGSDPFVNLQNLLTALEAGRGTAGGQAFDVNTAEDSEVISVAPVTLRGSTFVKVFNFAIARVHYQGQIQLANDVRVFFRLFAANSTGTDFHADTTYGRDPAAYPVPPASFGQHTTPTPGVQGGDYVSIPCFGAPRQDPTQAGAPNSLPALQFDTVNDRNLPATGGPIRDFYYGCFLDINGSAPVLPQAAPVGNPSGPWPPGSDVTLEPLRQAFIRNDHQCLVAEIAFDPVAINPGTSPFNSDKLAQRNISWSYAANPGVDVSRGAVEVFEVRPTPRALAASQPDEIMIDWLNVPAGQQAEIYLPAVSADAVLARASRLYPTHLLSRVDASTIGCLTGGVTYIPLPEGGGDGANLAGLMQVSLPPGIQRGQLYQVVVRQLTEAIGEPVPQPPPIELAATDAKFVRWRRVLGTFQVNIPVTTKELLLEREELRLSIFRWMAEGISRTSRWWPVFRRYLELIAIRVSELGGNPDDIKPSSNGYDGLPSGEPEPADVREYTGKVEALVYDHFGDFEGFVLELHDDEERRFESRETEVEELVGEAWEDRIVVTVVVSVAAPHRPSKILLRRSVRRGAR